MSFFPINWLKKITPFLYIIGFVGLFLVLSPLGYEVNGAKRWISIKGQSLQPSEVIKITVILLTALLINFLKDYLSSWIAFAIIAAGFVVETALVAVVTKDLGSAIIIFGIGFVMLLVASPKKRHSFALLGIGAIAGGIMIAVQPFRLDRVNAWLNLEKYSGTSGYQILQSLYAIGSGGLFGKGIGKSTQKMGFIPESQNDMIFSIICEELGIVGGILLLFLFALLIWKLKKIYDEVDGIYEKSIIIGVTTHIALQTIMNTAVVTGLIPNTGVPLPFISYGGTSIIFLMIEIGLVLAIERNQNKELKREEYYLAEQNKQIIEFQ